MEMRTSFAELAGEEQIPIKGQFGLQARVFALLTFVVGITAIFLSYFLAINQSPPDIKPFPQADLLHIGLRLPEYIVFRIGFLLVGPLMAVVVEALKNYLQIKSMEIGSQPEPKLKYMGWVGIFACVCLCLAVSAISDGGDMNYSIYVYGFVGWKAFTLWIMMRASAVYRKLWSKKKNFCSELSYNIKKFPFLVYGGLWLSNYLISEYLNLGYTFEWLSVLYIFVYMLTLYWDLQHITIDFVRE